MGSIADYDFLSTSIKQQFDEYSNDSISNTTSNTSQPSSSSQPKEHEKLNINQIKDLDRKSLMLIETYYRDKLITYQEKLKKEFDTIYNKKLQSLKSQYDNDSYLKLKQFELETKKQLLQLLQEFKELKNSKQQSSQQAPPVTINDNNNENNNITTIQQNEILNKLELISNSITDLFSQQQESNLDTIEFQSFLTNLNISLK